MNADTETDSGEPREEEPGDSSDFLAVVYDELRRLAAHKMAGESGPQTLDATALVHEAWLKLEKSSGGSSRWSHRRHFFNAAAEAMRRILIDRARAKRRQKRGGDLEKVELFESRIIAPCEDDEVLELSDALERLGAEKPELAEIVRLRYFVGITWAEIAELLETSESSLLRKWRYAKAWLRMAMEDGN
ncbi:MAG: sigma-70 family RNA polymerase sigma factor [Verrucomicrobiae bacterium]|nr:sigma-70 family RNA polymerase sigma factor [Verrucomicrobiae bacterium]